MNLIMTLVLFFSDYKCSTHLLDNSVRKQKNTKEKEELQPWTKECISQKTFSVSI